MSAERRTGPRGGPAYRSAERVPCRGRQRRRAVFRHVAVGLSLVTLVLGVPRPVAPQDDAGTSAGTLLRLTPSPRPLALGGAYGALAADPLALFYNPARLALGGDAAHLAFGSYPAGARAGSLAAAWRPALGTFGFGVQFLDLGEVREMEPDPAFGGQRGRPTGSRVGAGEVVVGAGWGAALGGGVHVGAAAKLLRIQIAEAGATGLAFDAGMGWDAVADRVSIAVALQNLGRDLGPGRTAPLPYTLRSGAALRVGRATGPRATFALDVLTREGRSRIGMGIEAGFALTPGRVALARIGYDGRRRGGGVAPIVFGGGLGLGSLVVDYAYRTIDPLGATHHFGLSIGSVP